MEQEMKKTEKNRIQWLDVLKGILILCVILSHSYPPELYRRFFTPFFLTMFFFASGYTFSTKSSFSAFLKNKAKRLLIPFFVLGFIRVAMAYVMGGGSLKGRVIGFLLQICCRDDELWFVSCLFVSSLLFYGLIKARDKVGGRWKDALLLGLSFGLMILGALDMCVWKVKCVWQLELACAMVFYMALGYLYRQYEEPIRKKAEKPAVILLLLAAYVALVLVSPGGTDIHAQRFPAPLCFFVLSLVILLPVLYGAKRLAGTGFRKILSFLGANTLFYYAFGGVVRIVFYGVCQRVGIASQWILPVCCMVLSAALLALPAWAVKKYAPWAVGA